jgi:hypothetical protein
MSPPIGIGGWMPEPDAGLTSLLPLGPDIWVRADQGVSLTSGKVSNWTDISGHGRDLTQATASARPSPSFVTIGGQPTIDFTTGLFSGYSAATMVNATSWPNQSTRTVFSVSVLLSPQSTDARFIDTGGSFSTDYALLCQDTGPSMCLIVNENSSGPPRINGGIDSGPSNITFTINGATAILYQHYVAVASRSTLSPITPGSTGRGVGDTKATGFGALFHLAEYAEWNRVLSSAELTLLNGYSAARYGI